MREKEKGHTMALIEFPCGPVTRTQAPHCAAEFQVGPARAVPYTPDGSEYDENMQFPPAVFPP